MFPHTWVTAKNSEFHVSPNINLVVIRKNTLLMKVIVKLI